MLAITVFLFGCSTDEAGKEENTNDTTEQTEENESGGISEEVVVRATLDSFLEKYIAEDYEGMKKYFASVNAANFDGDLDAALKSLEENDVANGVDRTSYEVTDFQEIDDEHYLATIQVELVAQDEEQSYEESFYVQLEDGEWKMNFTGSIDTETDTSENEEE